jgi:hypothetical protein
LLFSAKQTYVWAKRQLQHTCLALTHCSAFAAAVPCDTQHLLSMAYEAGLLVSSGAFDHASSMAYEAGLLVSSGAFDHASSMAYEAGLLVSSGAFDHASSTERNYSNAGCMYTPSSKHEQAQHKTVLTTHLCLVYLLCVQGVPGNTMGAIQDACAKQRLQHIHYYCLSWRELVLI